MPEVPKKTAPEEKLPYAPKVEKAPPAKGTILFIVVFRTSIFPSICSAVVFYKKNMSMCNLLFQ